MQALSQTDVSYKYDPIYWQTACLTINSGSLEVEENSKQKTTDYGKVAEAIGQMKSKGVNIAQPLINKAEFGFIPDTENNQIIFSLKGIVGVGDDIANAIIENRPFASFDDFYNRMYTQKIVQKKHMIQLIKAGAFNEFDTPINTMKKFLSVEVGVKEKLNMQNMKSIIELGLLDSVELKIYKELFNFKSYVSKMVVRQEEVKNGARTTKDKILGLDKVASDFYNSNFNGESIMGGNSIGVELSEKKFIKEYDELMKPFKDMMNEEGFLNSYNNSLLKKEWLKYAKGSVSKWEMDSLSYYNSKHELEDANTSKYNIVNFFDLSEEPEIFGYMEFRDKKIPKQKIFSIAGVIVHKNPIRHTLSVLTPDGVVTVKMSSGQFAHYGKQVSRRVGDKKEIVEKSWFARGNLVLLNGYRDGDMFKLKVYKTRDGEQTQHTINLIKKVEKNGDLVLQDERIRVQ